MNKRINYKKEIERVIHELHISHSDYNTGRHFSMAFGEYGDVWDMSDKEMLFALEKYQAELQLDENNIAPEDYVNKIVKDGMNLDEMDWQEDEDEWGDK